MILKNIKHLGMLMIIILLLSGCSIVYINKQSIDEIVDSILSEKTKLKSVSLEGYSYYLPQGVNLKNNNFLNSTLYYNHKKMYLYVDLISYYHKVKNTYTENKNYYSRKIDINNKSGYLEITELEHEYFVEFMYNYSKIEAYVDKDELNKTLTVMAYILRSIKFKDSVLDSLVGKSSTNYKEQQFNIYKSNGNDNGNFLDIIEEYDKGRIDSKDEDILDIEENIE